MFVHHKAHDRWFSLSMMFPNIATLKLMVFVFCFLIFFNVSCRSFWKQQVDDIAFTNSLKFLSSR